jgi:hypothetical protein
MFAVKILDEIIFLAAPRRWISAAPKAGGGAETTVEQALMRGLGTA